jgi:transcriptional regulator with XRE-family HTH domain
MDLDKQAADTEVQTSLFTPEKEQAVLRRLKELYERSGMTIPELVRITHLSESTVTRYVTGKTKNPHLYTMVTLVEVMGGNLYEILGLVPPTESVPVSAPVGNPYGELLDSFRDENSTLRSALDKITGILETMSAKLNRTSKTIAVLSVCLFVLLGLFCALEIVDLITPNWGRYQWAAGIFESFLQKV